ncbi:MAG: segregation/condensation protein A [Anaerolineales bacterium]|jgi:segregation and condensation protein A|nr:segregation/condensation protein A [Anaerolineales bacterium]
MLQDTQIAKPYTVVTPVFEGPLDLLLQLIEKAELDITALALAQVTDQFLTHLHALPQNTAADVSSFLIIAAKLVQIKSEALLPRPPVREPGEVDPGEALWRQLILYRKFKIVAEQLGVQLGNQRTFPRIAPVSRASALPGLQDLTIEELLQAAQQVFENPPDLPTLDSVVAAPRFTIREKILGIASYLQSKQKGEFSQLFSAKISSRLEIVVTFLALLELVKRHMLLARQADLFAEIYFEPAEDWQEDFAFELEFGE